MLSGSTSIRDDLLSAFGPQLASRPQVLDRLESYARIFNIPAESLHAKWEAYTLSPAALRLEEDLTLPSLQHLEDLQQELLRQQEAEKQKAILGSADTFMNARQIDPFLQDGAFDSDSLKSFLENGPDLMRGLGTPMKTRKRVMLKGPSSAGQKITPSKGLSTIPKTPSSVRFKNVNDFTSSPVTSYSPLQSHSSTQPSPNAAKFADRDKKGHKYDTFNDHVPLTEKTFEDQVQCDIALVPGQQTKGYRYMYEKLTAKGDFLDERIDTFADIIGQGIKASLPAEEHEEFAIQHPALPQQETLFTVGRVCCDSLTDDSKLNAQSVVVEASRAIGSGARVHLNLRQAPDYSLFPGQLIGVEGINPTGKSINVSRIHHPTLPAQATSEPSQLLSFYPSPDAAASINIIVANGPYTLSDSFNYEPFEELTVKVEAEKPDVVILQGPFVDSQHPLILSGDMEIDVDDIFRTQISPRLHRMLGSRSLKTKLICIPATTDSCSEWVSFPQPSLAAGLTDAATFERRAALGIPPEVHMFPNPVQFTINEVVFACCSMDVLWHMCGQEIWKLSPNNGQPAVQPHGATTFEMSTNRLTRFVQHMFRQRTFYPLFPPALDDACLDLSHAGALELQATPDVLIMPSRLQQFIRNIDGCVCVNPGSLVKGHSAGTFARFCIWPLELERIKRLVDEQGRAMTVDGETESLGIAHSVQERCRVELEWI